MKTGFAVQPRKQIVPPRLLLGDQIRVIAPSRSLAFVSQDVVTQAQQTFEKIGLKVTMGENSMARDEFDSSPAEGRLADFHDAFRDPAIKAVFSAIGGYNSNQLLDRIDYSVVAAHPKILCGYSDITVLNNAVWAQTGLRTYSGPHFSSLGMKHGVEFVIACLKSCLCSAEPYEIVPSKVWSDDLWFLNQEDRAFEPNPGHFVINRVNQPVEGIVIGGHISSFASLHGTAYMPSLADCVLFLEATADINAQHFDRLLQALSLQPGFDGVRALCIGRFQRSSKVTFAALEKIVRDKRALDGIPVIANLDFGHTEPIITFPIGGRVRIEPTGTGIRMTIIEH